MTPADAGGGDAPETVIHPTALVDPRVELGAGAVVGPYCILEGPIQLGDRVRLLSHVSVQGRVTIGEDTVVHPFCALGHPPQDTKYKGGDTTLIIGPRNTLREQVTMHRGTEVGRGQTVIGGDNLFMVATHVAHDCIVGDRCTFANQATLGGHAVVGDQVIMGGLSAVHQNCRAGRQSFIGAGAILTGDLIPFGMLDNHGRLAGLNLIGLKRRGHTRAAIHELRAAYRLLFAGEGVFTDRLAAARSQYAGNAAIQEMIAFIDAGGARPLAIPGDR